MMTRTRRLSAVFVGAVIVSLGLGGCSFLDDAGQVWGIVNSDFEKQRSLTGAASALERLDGVKSAASAFTAAGLSGPEAELHVTVGSETTPEQARVIYAATRQALEAPELDGALSLFTLRSNGTTDGLLTQNCFRSSDDEFEADFTFWRGAEAAIGAPLSMTLTPSATLASCDRSFTATEQSDAVNTAEMLLQNFEALAAVPDETQNFTVWNFAGMLASPRLPSAPLMELLDNIRNRIPLIDYSQLPENPGPDFDYPEGVLLSIIELNPAQPLRAEIVITQREYRNADWKNAIAAGARATKVPDLIFRYVTPLRQFQFHTSRCEGALNLTNDDQKFFDAVLAGGGELLPGAGPGACIPER